MQVPHRGSEQRWAVVVPSLFWLLGQRPPSHSPLSLLLCTSREEWSGRLTSPWGGLGGGQEERERSLQWPPGPLDRKILCLEPGRRGALAAGEPRAFPLCPSYPWGSTLAWPVSVPMPKGDNVNSKFLKIPCQREIIEDRKKFYFFQWHIFNSTFFFPAFWAKYLHFPFASGYENYIASIWSTVFINLSKNCYPNCLLLICWTILT